MTSINEQLDKMSQGGRQAIYREMADGSSISEIFALNPIYRQQVVKLLKQDSEARFKLRLSQKGADEVMDLRSADGGHLAFKKGVAKEVSFRNAMHLYYTYGPEAPVEIHRGLVECAGRAEASGEKGEKDQVETDRLRAELEQARAEAAKLKAKLDAKGK